MAQFFKRQSYTFFTKLKIRTSEHFFYRLIPNRGTASLLFTPHYVISDKFGHKLVGWYLTHHRRLPWRETKDPYRIWLSEIILQQTRVAQGLPYYEKFVLRFPDVASLAQATEKEVLHLWQGLGYYSRARNMHATARMVATEYNGAFPATYDELIGLKGIGDYTASAIASFAFDQPTPVVDGNVFRVLSRFYGLSDDIALPASRKIFKETARLSMPEGKAALFNQAIMEFGALQCTPATPKCTTCAVGDSCYAYHKGAQSDFPVKTKKTKIKARYIHYLVIKHQGKIAMKERKDRDIWRGLYDFHLSETTSPEIDWQSHLPGQLRLSTPLLQAGPLRHLLSHQHLYLSFWTADLQSEGELPTDLHWYTEEEIKDLPKPLPINMYLLDFL